MLDMSIIVWWFPILFMLHEMEEIIFIGPWKKRRDENTRTQDKKQPYEDFLSAESFSLAVLEEFIIILIVTISSWSFRSYYVWLGLYIGITIHYALHILISIVLRMFIPGVVTSVIMVVISMALIRYVINELEMDVLQVVVWSVITSVLFFVNLRILHKLMPYFESRLHS